MSLAAGTRLGPYEVLSPLGAGGMGEVYRARDTRLEREVALKILGRDLLGDESARKRFRKEAQALAKLNHPHIAQVHDFATEQGVDFLVMELVPGETLSDRLARGPLPEPDVRKIVKELAEGLAAAHAEGVIHCDLKPANLRLSRDGILKILDFGLARLRRPTVTGDATASLKGTEVAVSGTLPYMAPEQLRAESLDVRTDLWGAGAVLYELATGTRPFRDAVPAKLTDAILHTDPEPPSTRRPEVSAELSNVILRCLEKDPDRRFQSANELRSGLERLTSPTAPTASTATPKRSSRVWLGAASAALLGALALSGVFLFGRTRPISSVAVLPFVNASGTADLEYLSDGIAEELINSLTQVQALKVIARPTAFSYKGRPVEPRDIGSELKVRAVVMGRLSRRADTISVQVDLVDTAEGAELWGGKFERRLGEIASLQQDINRQVTSVLRVKLTSDQKKRLARPQTDNAEAFQLYLRGRRFLSEMSTASEYLKSLDYFKQAVQKDPDFAKGWAGLADGYAYLSFEDLEPAREVMPKAREAAQKALALDPDLAEAHTSLGIVKMYYDRDLPGAEVEFRKAIELNPGEDFSRHWYAHYLEKVQRFEEANAELRRVVELDPLSPMYTGDLALQYYFMRQPEKVVEIALKNKSPGSVSPWEVIALALAYEMLGRREESLATIGKVTATDPIYRGFAGALLARQGRRAEAERILAEMRAQKGYVPSFQLALVHLGLGQTDETFRYLEMAYADRSSALYDWILIDPQWSVVHDDPRYKDLLRRLRLPSPKPARGSSATR
ncbi:MAG: protein kinase [Thermoanaerobaculia bacterium]